MARIQVNPGKQTRIDTPVSLSLEGLTVSLDSGFRLEEVREGKRVLVPSQVEPGYSSRLWWIQSGKTEPGSIRTYELMKGESRESSFLEVIKDARVLEIRKGENQILTYHHALVPPPEGADRSYTRSGFIHPVWSPAGAELTRIHPPDHIHHMGLWNPYAQTVFEGREVDFWNLKKSQGTVRFKNFNALIQGPVFSGFRALQDHLDLKAPGGEKTALHEEWEIRVWNVGGRDQGYWLWDFTSFLSCASSSPITLKKYRYGGFGFRATASWDEGNYLTSEGKQREDGQGTRARWCNVFGPTDKGPAGILFMSHPQNHEHPEPMRIWSDRPQIFFSFCPIQKADWVLIPGKQYVLRYRLFVYDKEITPEQAERLWQDFGDPPRVEVEWLL